MPLADPSVASAAAQLGTGVSSLDFPSIGRLVLGFAITVALAVGVALVLRRVWPLLHRRGASSSQIRLLGRTAVSSTLTVHLVEIDGVRLAVAEARNGIAVAAIPPASGTAQGANP